MWCLMWFIWTSSPVDNLPSLRMRLERPQHIRTSTNVTRSHEGRTTATLCTAVPTEASFLRWQTDVIVSMLYGLWVRKSNWGTDSERKRRRWHERKRKKREETGTKKVFRVTRYKRERPWRWWNQHSGIFWPKKYVGNFLSLFLWQLLIYSVKKYEQKYEQFLTTKRKENTIFHKVMSVLLLTVRSPFAVCKSTLVLLHGLTKMFLSSFCCRISNLYHHTLELSLK